MLPSAGQLRRPPAGSHLLRSAQFRQRAGGERLFAAAPLVGQDVYVVHFRADPRAWSPGPGSTRFQRAPACRCWRSALALVAVVIVAERGVVRWIAYLQRIAAIYARGRFSVRPVQAERAPPEIRDLADTLGAVAATNRARDAALLDHPGAEGRHDAAGGSTIG